MIDGAEVQDLLFNDFDRVETIVLKAGASLKKVEFDTVTAKFSQSQSRQEGWPRVVQRVTFEHDGIPNQALRSLKRLAEHCNVHVIVETHAGQFFYMGVSYYADRGYAWDTGNSSVASGSANVDAVGGQVKITTTLEATVRQFAPEVEADITTLNIEEPPPPDPVVDNTPPVALVFIPADDAICVDINPTISVIFNEAIKVGTAGYLQLYDYATDTLVAQWNMEAPAEVVFDQQAASFTVVGTIPTLAYNTQYYFLIGATAVRDLADNYWPGISAKDDWEFTTCPVPDTTPPTLVALTPPDEGTGINPVGLVASIQLNEDVAAGIGNIFLYDYATDNLLASYDINTTTIIGDTVSFDISADVTTDQHYYILIPAGVITDLEGNAFAGFAAKEDWDFETNDTTAPAVVAYFPPHNTSTIAIVTELYIDVGEVVVKGTGTIKLVEAVDLTGPTDEGGNDIIHHTWDVATSPDIVLTAGGTRINFDNNPVLVPSRFYYFVIPTGAFEDGAGNSFPSHHVTGTPDAVWFFTTLAPLTLVFGPTNGGTVGCWGTALLNVGYIRAFGTRRGWVKVYDYDTDTLLAWYDIGNSDPDSGSHPAYNPTRNSLIPGRGTDIPWLYRGEEFKFFGLPFLDSSSSHVYVIMEAGMLYDPVHLTDLPVPTAKGDWHFFVSSPDVGTGSIADLTPGNGEQFAITNPLDGGYVELVVTFDTWMVPADYISNAEGKFLRIYDFDTGDQVGQVRVSNRRNVFALETNNGPVGSEDWAIIVPDFILDEEKKYNITLDAGAFVNECGTTSAAINIGEWQIFGPSYDPAAVDGFDSGFDSGFQ